MTYYKRPIILLSSGTAGLVIAGTIGKGWPIEIEIGIVVIAMSLYMAGLLLLIKEIT